jgi:BirA family transcriptional regulator, biotin operon repressor / biotin---[acetyl-CoA-carboxylase] ligase
VSQDSPPARLGAPRVHLRLVDSTNRHARELAGRGAPHGTLVSAGAQSAGRGRQGRSWIAPPGRAILCSLVIRDHGRMLPLAAGVAVAELAGPQARVKWPNDVLLQGRKVAGILVEARPSEGWAVLGIGVNVAVAPEDLPAELRGRAGGLGLGPEELEPALERLLGLLERWLAVPEDGVLAELRARDALLGRHLSWAGGEGEAAGIDADGRLVVQSDGRRVALDAGEVHLG